MNFPNQMVPDKLRQYLWTAEDLDALYVPGNQTMEFENCFAMDSSAPRDKLGKKVTEAVFSQKMSSKLAEGEPVK